MSIGIAWRMMTISAQPSTWLDPTQDQMSKHYRLPIDFLDSGIQSVFPVYFGDEMPTLSYYILHTIVTKLGQ
jgi:hypothetical protein